MKVLVCGDLQICCSDPASDRTRWTRDMLGWVVAETTRIQPDMFVHLGDFGEDNRGADHYTLTMMSWFLKEMCARVPESYWLVGNHDYHTADGSVNLMSALAYLLPENHHVPFPWAAGPEGTFFVSYLTQGTKERFRAEMGLLFREQDRQVLFSHLPVNGAMFAPGRFEQKGLEPEWFPPHTIVGHYHKPNPPSTEQFRQGRCLWYAGAPMSHDFRDNCYGLRPEEQLRGMWLFDIQDGAVTVPPTFIPNPHARYFVALETNVDSYGNLMDVWWNTDCVLPKSRTIVRVTAPKESESAIRQALLPVESATVLTENRHASGVDATQVARIDPQAEPTQAVEAYVDGLAEKQRDGLAADTLKSVGRELVLGRYQPPALEGGNHAG